MKEYGLKSKIRIYQVDAFTDEPFKGNPAAVCLLQHQYEDHVLQSIAAEMNLSETAFIYSLDDKPLKDSRLFSLRWFTPKVEVPLCGHATLATAAVLFYDVGVSANKLNFDTKSGRLTAQKDKNGILLNFPMNENVPIEPPQDLLKALGVTNFKYAGYAERAKTLLLHLPDREDVKNLRPNFELMRSTTKKEDIRGVIVTSTGHPPRDFVSRFFAPWLGINEDPVTGAAHTVLTPYWSKILGKRILSAYQASPRGGKLIVQLDRNDRVNLIGAAVIVLRGELYL